MIRMLVEKNQEGSMAPGTNFKTAEMVDKLLVMQPHAI